MSTIFETRNGDLIEFGSGSHQKCEIARGHEQHVGKKWCFCLECPHPSLGHLTKCHDDF